MAILGFIFVNLIALYILLAGGAMMWWDGLHNKFNIVGFILASFGIGLIYYSWYNKPFTVLFNLT